MKKFKVRFSVCEDQQMEGTDFFKAYAPAVQWTMVQLMLILEILLQLKLKKREVTSAFLQSKLGENEKVCVRMPLGFRKQGIVLKLKKTLYGLHQSPSPFWKYLTKAMKAVGMRVSNWILACLL